MRLLNSYSTVLFGLVAVVGFAYTVLTAPTPQPQLIPLVLFGAALLLLAFQVGRWSVARYRSVRSRLRRLPDLEASSAALAQRVEALEHTNESLQRRVDSIPDELDSAREQGVQEGMDRTFGFMAGPREGIMPTLTMTARDGGLVTFLAESPDGGERIDQGGRMTLINRLTGQVLGVLEVSDAEPESRELVLVCVDPIHPEYWISLERRSESDMAAPTGVELVPYDPWEHHQPGVYQRKRMQRDPEENAT